MPGGRQRRRARAPKFPLVREGRLWRGSAPPSGDPAQLAPGAKSLKEGIRGRAQALGRGKKQGPQLCSSLPSRPPSWPGGFPVSSGLPGAEAMRASPIHTAAAHFRVFHTLTRGRRRSRSHLGQVLTKAAAPGCRLRRCPLGWRSGWLWGLTSGFLFRALPPLIGEWIALFCWGCPADPAAWGRGRGPPRGPGRVGGPQRSGRPPGLVGLDSLPAGGVAAGSRRGSGRIRASPWPLARSPSPARGPEGRGERVGHGEGPSAGLQAGHSSRGACFAGVGGWVEKAPL